MIQLFHLSKTSGPRVVLNNMNLKIGKGEFVFVTGPSGAGKTTLLRMLFGAEKPSSGHILINAINLNRISRPKLDLLRRKIGFVFQDFKLLPRKTVFENVAIALEVTGLRPRFIRKKTHQTLRSVGLADKEKVYPLSLSGGEQQWVAITRGIVKDPLILLADEPTGNLDSDLTLDIMSLFRHIHERGTTVVVATHCRELIAGTQCRTIVLHRGTHIWGYAVIVLRFYFLRQALLNMKRNLTVQILGLGTIIACLLILGAFLLLFINLNNSLGQWGSALSMSVYL